jgi:hypothetical protein
MANSSGSKRKSDGDNPPEKKVCPPLAFFPENASPEFYAGFITGLFNSNTVGTTTFSPGVPIDFYRGFLYALSNFAINLEDQPVACPVATPIEEPSASEMLSEKSDSGLSVLMELIGESTYEPRDALDDLMPSRTTSVESTGSGPVCPLVD